MKLGCIADDFTGAGDVASVFSSAGLKTRLFVGTPSTDDTCSCDVGVVSLKIRSVDATVAANQALSAVRWFQGRGVEQFMYKYCSTFDSTPEGNIGPVLDALSQSIGADRVVVCPAFPDTGRYVFAGHLFVHDQLLSESGMRHHPLTPMTDSDIRRWLSLQTSERVGHVSHDIVRAGAEEVARAISALGERYIVVDATTNEDLLILSQSLEELPLVSGASGVALAMTKVLGPSTAKRCDNEGIENATGPAVVLSGSCSAATLEQVDFHKCRHPSLDIDVSALMDGSLTCKSAIEFLLENRERLPIVYSSLSPDRLKLEQNRFGQKQLAARIEEYFGGVARGVISAGITNLIVAGGETSGAVVEALGMSSFEIGPLITPGVPVLAETATSRQVVLKSGNFGGVSFFSDAARIMGAASDG